MHETYILIQGAWKYMYRAVDKAGHTVDFLLTAQRDQEAATRFFNKAMASNDVPEKVAMDKSGANKAAIDDIIENRDLTILIRQAKYLNNIVEQEHRAIKRIVRPMLGFKAFQSAKSIIAGIELMHMIRKGQMIANSSKSMSFAEQFYALAR